MHAIALLMLLAASPGDDKELAARCDAATQTRDDGRNEGAYQACLERRGAPAAPDVDEAPASKTRAEVDREEANRRYQQQMADLQAAADAKDEAMQKRCGKDYHRIRVGMSFARVQQCAGVELWVKYADATNKVYEGDGGLVRVEHGKVVSVLFE
jgi:hypothetical protein